MRRYALVLVTMLLVGTINYTIISCSKNNSSPPATTMARSSALTSSGCPCCPCDAGVVVADATQPSDAATPTVPPVPTSHPRIYVNAHKARLQSNLAAKTTSATRWRGAVDRWVAGSDLWGFQNWHGALLSVLTGETKYCTKAVANIESQVKAAEAKIAANSNPAVAGDSYLEVGDYIGDLALVYDWCHPQVTDAQKKRWIAYANQAVWNVWNFKQASWGGRSAPWTGWSVDNPSNNYHYSFMRATMLLGLATKGENEQAETHLSTFKSKMANLATVFNRDLAGGGSREGTGYGVAMRRLFELYSWWQASTGEQLATRTNHTRASLLAFIHQIAPTLDRFAPIGDQSRDSTAMMFDYQRHYLLELANLFPTDTLSGRAKDLLAASSVPQMQNSFMLVYDFLLDNPSITPKPLDGLGLGYYARGISGLYFRSAWKKDATWVGLQGGPYTESHAHQDQSSLLVYDGGWLVSDAVIHSRSGLPQDTKAHSMVRIDTNDGIPLKQFATTSSNVTALASGPGWHFAAVDATPTYRGSPYVQLVQRQILFLHAGVVVVFDRVKSTSVTKQVLQFVMPIRPTIASNVATAGKLTVYKGGTGAWKVTDMKTVSSDFTGGFRLDLERVAGDNRYLTVLSVDGAASKVTVSESSTTFILPDGKTVAVSFVPEATGGSLTIGTKVTLEPKLFVLPE